MERLSVWATNTSSEDAAVAVVATAAAVVTLEELNCTHEHVIKYIQSPERGGNRAGREKYCS